MKTLFHITVSGTPTADDLEGITNKFRKALGFLSSSSDGDDATAVVTTDDVVITCYDIPNNVEVITD